MILSHSQTQSILVKKDLNGGPQLSSLVVHNGQLKSAEELEVHYKPVKQSSRGTDVKA